MEKALYRWVMERREQHLLVTSTEVRRQAMAIADSHKIPDSFKFSCRWLQGFYSRWQLKVSVIGLLFTCNSP